LELTREQADSQSASPSFNTHSSLLTLIVVANNDDDYDAILQLTERLSTAVWHLNVIFIAILNKKKKKIDFFRYVL